MKVFWAEPQGDEDSIDKLFVLYSDSQELRTAKVFSNV